MSEMKIEVIDVSPEIARKWLATSRGNRNHNKNRTAAYVEDMQMGRWVIGDPIQFSEGHLINGHHRLEAVLQYGLPVRFAVVTGYPSESIIGIDMCQPRSDDQVSKFAGEGYSKRHFAIARIMEFGMGEVSTKSFASYSTKRDALLKYEGAINWTVLNAAKAKYLSAPVLAVVSRAYYSCDQTRLKEFLQILETGLPKSEEDWAPVRLRNFIQDAERVGHKAIPAEVYWRAESAVYYFCKRKPVKLLRPATRELFPLKLNADGRVVPE